LLVTIGYGFGDEHINGMLGQALRNDKNKRILCAGLGLEKGLLVERLKPKPQSQIVIKDCKASEFMKRELSIEKLESLLPTEESIFTS